MKKIISFLCQRRLLYTALPGNYADEGRFLNPQSSEDERKSESANCEKPILHHRFCRISRTVHRYQRLSLSKFWIQKVDSQSSVASSFLRKSYSPSHILIEQMLKLEERNSVHCVPYNVTGT